MELKNSFINKQGKEYIIRNLCFDNCENNLNFGEYITESSRDTSSFYCSENGVYIFKSLVYKNRAYRIYKDFKTSHCGAFQDAELIINLQKKQSNVFLTEFPTGIITLNSLIIGQEIPFYQEYITLRKFIKNNGTIDKNTIILILKIFRELLSNDIIYSDIHSNNILINPNNFDIKLIDFDPTFVKFEFYKSRYEDMIKNLLVLLKNINNQYNLNLDLNDIELFEQIEQKVLCLK